MKFFDFYNPQFKFHVKGKAAKLSLQADFVIFNYMSLVVAIILVI